MEEPKIQPSLFITSSTWFRASDYELHYLRGQLYVVPKKDAIIETYLPFNCFPDILQAFMETARQLKTINDTYNLQAGETKSESEDERLMKLRDQDMGKTIIRCARRYGLLGLMFYFTYKIEDWKSSDPEDPSKLKIEYIVRGRHSARSLGLRFPFPSSAYANKNNMPYEDYAAGFFPRLTSEYPLPNVKNSFRNEYGEPVLSIFAHLNESLWNLTAWNEWLIARRAGASLEDPMLADTPRLRWIDYLNRRIQAREIDYAMEYNANGEGTWQESFRFHNLLSALHLMLIRDSIKKVHQVRICEECSKIYTQSSTRDSRYCSTACASKYRVTKFRKKKQPDDL
jgi:hypothetical protein